MKSFTAPIESKMETGLRLGRNSLFTSLGEDWICFDGDGTPRPLDGWLTTKNARMKVQVRYASAHSMYIEYIPGLQNGDVENLELIVGDEPVAIGPCKFFQKTELGHGIARLVPSSTFYDLERFFFPNTEKGTDTISINTHRVWNTRKK